MKTYYAFFLRILLAAFFINSNFINAQQTKESDFSASIKSSLLASNKGAKIKKLEKEKNGLYKVRYNLNKVEYLAVYNSDGNLMETESEIKIADLPKDAADYVSKNYNAYKIKEAGKVKHVTGPIYFKAEIKKGKEEKALLFSEGGIFIKAISEEEGENEEND